MAAAEGTAANDLLVLLAALLLYAAFARQLARAWISPALYFTVVGLIVGTSVLGWYETTIGAEPARILASLALATVLFGDATKVRLRRLRRNAGEPSRLLTIGLLGTVALGAVAARLLFGEIGWGIALVIAVILAPTDAALGEPVVENPAIPQRVRESLFVESGLNDGIAVPLLVVALAVADLSELGDTSIAQLLLMKIAVSAILGAVIAVASYAALQLARRHGGLDPVWSTLLPLLAALACFLLVEEIGGSGFIAAFVGGLAFGGVARRREEIGIAVDEAVSSLLQGATWFLFGALIAGPVLLGGGFQPLWLVYALLSLTVVRMVPVAVALLGTGEPARTVLFMGWFGPRGLASVVFLLLVLGMGPSAADSSVIEGTVASTVLLSIVLHGLTATPFVRRYVASLPPPPPERAAAAG